MSYFEKNLPSGTSMAMDQVKTKCSWPELIDSDVYVAQQLVQREAPLASVELVTRQTHLWSNIDMGRVRIFYDPLTNLVIAIPKRG